MMAVSVSESSANLTAVLSRLETSIQRGIQSSGCLKDARVKFASPRWLKLAPRSSLMPWTTWPATYLGPAKIVVGADIAPRTAIITAMPALPTVDRSERDTITADARTGIVIRWPDIESPPTLTT